MTYTYVEKRGQFKGCRTKYYAPRVEHMSVYKDLLTKAYLIQSVCRLCGKACMSVSGIRFHCDTCFIGNEAFHAGLVERGIMRCLRARPSVPIHTNEIVQHIWYGNTSIPKEEGEDADNNIKACLSRIRRLMRPIEKDCIILTQWGLGYELRINEAFSRQIYESPIKDVDIQRIEPTKEQRGLGSTYKFNGIIINRGSFND